MTSSTSSYSSLFTAGLFGFPSTSRTNLSPPPISTTSAPPSISIRPSSPPRRRRKSSATIGSSPMAAIKSPAQRAQFSHRSAQKGYGIMVTSPGRTLTFPPPSTSTGSSVYTVPENRSLMRPRRGLPPPPLLKPAPEAPLPALPFADSTKSNAGATRNPNFRRDSDTLPLPSPTFLAATPAAPSGQYLLAPSPTGGRLSPGSGSSSPMLMPAFDESEENAPGQYFSMNMDE